MKEIRRLTVLGRYGYDSIPTITQFVADAALAASLDQDAIFHCQMAADEACTNIIEHAYGGSDAGNIEITCFVQPGTCTIQIVDHGVPFDPIGVPEPKTGAILDEIKPGGIGLHLMRHFMDDVRFEFTEQGNTLTMTKSASSPSGPAEPQDIPMQEERQGIWVVQPRGQLDAINVPHLEKIMVEMISQGRIWIVVDMEQVSYIASRGLKALVSAWREAGDAKGKLVLCAIIPRVLTIFETIGFTQIFDIYPSRDAAVAALAAQKAARE